jgi:hypothetical protein
MNLPNFTAEASLDPSRGTYYRAFQPSPSEPYVEAALCFPEGSCGPCRNGFQRCCENGRIVLEECGGGTPDPVCGPCVGSRTCSDGTSRPCTV